MKKMILALCFVLVLAAALALPAAAQESLSPDGSVLFEKDGVRVTAAGLDYDPTVDGAEPILWVDIENSGEKDAFLGVSGGSVNGFMDAVMLITFAEEDGFYFGADYGFDLTLPAGSTGRYALGYEQKNIPGVALDELGEMTFCFTLAKDAGSWPDYFSEPVTVVTGEGPEQADIRSLGTVVIDDEKLTLVLGEQDYDDWFGPVVYVYAQNKSDSWLGLQAETAEGDGTFCDYIYFYQELAPGRLSAGTMSFEGELRELRGFEKLDVSFRLDEAATQDELGSDESAALVPVSVQYPPQRWGEYENGGLRLEIRPKYNELITVKTPSDDADGVLFDVSETASLEAGDFDGAGWLFSIARCSEERVHELLCYDMSGVSVFARDAEGNYYLYCHPTDVRYTRASVEEMQRDQAQWSMLCQWAETVPDSLADSSGLEYVAFGNTEVDMALARAAWQKDAKATLSTLEYGPVSIAGVDGSPYAAFVMQGWFMQTDLSETPDGEYVVLEFPDDGLRVDFFFAPGAYVRTSWGGMETLYTALWIDEEVSYTEAMQGWYYAAAEQAGIRTPDESLAPFCGSWREKIAGRGALDITPSLAPGKLSVAANWPESAAVLDTWEMTAVPAEDGSLRYENGIFRSTEYGEGGESWDIDGDWGVSGELRLTDDGELTWRDSRLGDETNTFVR